MEEAILIALIEEQLSSGNYNLIHDNFYNLKEDIVELLDITIPDEFFNYEDIYDQIDQLINDNKQTILQFNSFNPIQHMDIDIDKDRMEKQINYLRQLPQPNQRTDEWYMYRHKLITASSAWKVFSSDKIKNSLIYEKCKELNIDKYTRVNLNTPFHWGNKYEPISIQIYEDLYKTRVEDFGCIKSDDYDFLGASPDGINIDKTSEKYGIMLEIKNVVSREITGIPKYEYWVQMQMQMGVCKLDYCDFLETKFIEYKDKQEFMEDGSFNLSKDNKQKGIIMCFMVNNTPVYEYSPLHLEESEFLEWELDKMNQYEHKWLTNIYWKLEVFSCILIKRNIRWFDRAVPLIKDVYDTIEHEKTHGYQHRASKKMEKKANVYIPPFSGCVIHL